MREPFRVLAAVAALIVPVGASACDLDGIYGHRFNPLAKLFGDGATYDDGLEDRIAANRAAASPDMASPPEPPIRAATRVAVASVVADRADPTDALR